MRLPILFNLANKSLALLLPFLAYAVTSIQPVEATLVVHGFLASRHDRFANDPTFLGNNFDFSGVGRSEGIETTDSDGNPRISGAGWVTLLQNPAGGSATHFVSADHARPRGQVSFFTGNDPMATPIVCNINAGGTKIGTTDIWIGTLDTTATGCDTSSLQSYAVSADIPSQFVGSTAIQAGISNRVYDTQNSLRTTNMRFGRNTLSFVVTDTLIGRTGDWMVYQDDSAAGDLIAPQESTTEDLGQDETLFQGGDSGGPSFLVSGSNTIELIGIHSFVGELSTNDADEDGLPDVATDGEPILTPSRRASGDAYLPSSRTAILAEITAVPEPGSFVQLGILILLTHCVKKVASKL